MTHSRSRRLVIAGLVLMLAGALDPLEGSVVILAGSALTAAGAFFGKTRRYRLQVTAFVLIAIGVCGTKVPPSRAAAESWVSWKVEFPMAMVILGPQRKCPGNSSPRQLARVIRKMQNKAGASINLPEWDGTPREVAEV